MRGALAAGDCGGAWPRACAHHPGLSRCRDPQAPLAEMASPDSLDPPAPLDPLDPLASEE